jgi:hypothetical protein
LMTTSEKNEKISCYKLLIQLTQFKVSAWLEIHSRMNIYQFRTLLSSVISDEKLPLNKGMYSLLCTMLPKHKYSEMPAVFCRKNRTKQAHYIHSATICARGST